MNFSPEDLEKELKAMVPHAPSRALETRISMDLDAPSDFKRKSGVILFWQPFAMAMAASIALVAAIIYTMPHGAATDNSPSQITRVGNQDLFQPQSDVVASNLETIEATQHLTNAYDEGIVYNDEKESLRQFRYHFVDTLTLRDKNNGNLYSMAIPREEIVLVPLATF